jgi:CheY-like chemotaxis protein
MKKKVLVVDDSVTMIRIIVNTLKRLDFKDIYSAENGFLFQC